MLRQLPQNIGTLNKLQLLDVAKNNLMFLPGTIQHLQLCSLDISDNLFSTIVDHNIVFDKSIFMGLPSLVESSARNVLKFRFFSIVYTFFYLYMYIIGHHSKYIIRD